MNPIKENLTKILNLENLPEQEREDILIRVGAIVFQNVLTRTLELMSDEEQDEFEKLLDKNGSPEEIFEFLQNKVADFNVILEEEALKFKDKSLNILSQIEE